MANAAFYFDLASPQAYLAAERILHTLGGRVEWVPVLARKLGDTSNAPAAFAAGGTCETTDPPGGAGAPLDRAGVELRAAGQGLMPIRWPGDFPFDSELAMLAATYAASIGRAIPFAQAAFRQAFAGGRSLAQIDNVLIAAAACEMHPRAVLAATRTASVRAQLASVTTAASVVGVSYVPGVRIGESVFAGPDAIEDAAAFLGLSSADDPQAKARTR